MSRLLRVVVVRLCALAFVVMPAIAAAQVTTGAVSGVVHDEQGGVIPGATVLLISETRDTRSVPVTSGADGGYSFSNVAPDRYAIEVSMSGFRTSRRSGLQVSPGVRPLDPVIRCHSMSCFFRWCGLL